MTRQISLARGAAVARAFWGRLKTDRLLQAQVLLWTAIISRVIVLMVMSRGWFFTNDDWDYLTRDGVLSIARPHSGHITATVAGLGMIARQIGGLDYWPVYPFVVSLAWPAAGYAAWWTWRRSDVAPMPAAIGAAAIVWLVSGAYIQFSHTSMAMTVATLIVAVRIDEERLTPGRGVMSFILSMAAVFAGSSGVVVTAVRGTLALGYRKWTGVVGALPALAIYAVVRSIVSGSGGTDKVDIGFGFGDLWTIFRILGHLIGPGLRWVFFVPGRLEGAATLLLIVLAVVVLIRARFSYRATTLILSGWAFVVAVAVVRWLNSPDDLQQLFDGRLDTRVLGVRYTNLPLVTLLMVAMPMILLWMQRGKVEAKRVVMGAAALFLIIGGVVQTARMWDEISDKSLRKSTEAAAVTMMVLDGEPIARPIGRRAGGTNGGWFTFKALLDMEEEGALREITESDIYRVREALEVDEPWLRGQFRFRTEDTANPSSWSDVGLPDNTGCVLVTNRLELQILDSVRIELVLGDGNEQRKPVVMVWTDGFGVGSFDIRATKFSEDGRVFVRTAGVADGSPRAVVSVEAKNVKVCLTD